MAGIGTYSLSAATAFAFFQSGLFTCSSVLAVPALLSGPTPQAVLTSWRVMFELGKVTATSLGLLSTTFFAISTGSAAYEGQSWTGKAGGMALAAAFIPYTLTIMDSTNNALLGDKLKDTAVRGVVQKWSSLNLARAVLPFTAGVVGLSILIN